MPLFFDIFENDQDVYQAQQIKGSDGQILSDREEVKEQWMPYFEELINMENKRDRRIVEPGKEVQVASIKRQEMERALKKMKKGKAVGPDDIPAEVWKVLGGVGLYCLMKVLRNVMETERMPDDW